MPSTPLIQTFPDYPAFISVDIETAGTYPRDYALLSIGACTLSEPRETFYIERKPNKLNMSEGSALVHGLSMKDLQMAQGT